MLDEAFQRLPGEVEPVVVGIAAFQQGHDAQRLGVVVEAAVGLHAGVQRLLAGVAEGRMAEIVRQRHRLGEILVERQRPRERPGDLADLDRMGQPRAEMIAVERHEDLRLVREAAEGGRMDDAVAVALELAARRRRRLGDRAGRASARRRRRKAREAGEAPRSGSSR